MNYILDGIALAIILVFTVRSYNKGFVKTAVLFFGFLIAAFLAKTLAPPVSNFIYNTFVQKSVTEAVTAKATEIGTTATVGATGFIEKLPAFIRNCINISGTDVGGIASGKAAELAASLEKSIIAPAVTSFINTVVFIIFFIVFGFALRFVGKFLGFFNKIPLVGPVNKFLGGLVGVTEGIIIVFLFCAVIRIALALFGEKFPVKPENITESYLFRLFYDLNIGMLIKKG